MAAVETIELGANLVFGAGPDGMTGQAFVEGALTFFDVLRRRFLQYREVGGRDD